MTNDQLYTGREQTLVKKMNTNTNPCPLCGGNKTSGKTTFTADLGSGVVVVRRVQATVCSQCGE